MLIIKLSFWTTSFCFEEAGHWGVWLHFSELGFILSRRSHPIAQSCGIFLEFSHFSECVCFIPLELTFCPRHNKPDSELLANSSEASGRESLHLVSLDSQLRHCFLFTFPARDVPHTVNKPHAEQSNRSDEDGEETETSQHEKPMSVNIITAERFQISVRPTQ